MSLGGLSKITSRRRRAVPVWEAVAIVETARVAPARYREPRWIRLCRWATRRGDLASMLLARCVARAALVWMVLSGRRP